MHNQQSRLVTPLRENSKFLRNGSRPPRNRAASFDKRSVSAAHIYAALKEAILSFTMYPGSRFTETELAEQFAVSRTPIREALQRLSAEHLVIIRPKQGCFVRDVNINELVQHYEVRIELELLALQLAGRRMSDDALKKLAVEWDPAMQRGRSADIDVMDLREESFHLALAGGGGNQALYDYIVDINHHIRIVRRLDFTSAERIDRTFEEHHGIVQHLLRRDVQSAQQFMRDHIMRSMEFARTLTLIELRRKNRFRY